MMKMHLRPTCHLLRQLCRRHSTATNCPRVAIVGSGPAGFYTAQQILKGHPQAEVDIYEKLPVPFGLVRFGVAPDHPEVKNVINTFTKTASNHRCSFLGNVCVGRDISVDDLQKSYTAVVLAYGADQDQTLGIPGEDLNGVLSARSFVGWYNGLPEHVNLQPNLDTDTAVILGQGNVAIDVARMLLTPIDILRKTDITEYAAEALLKSQVKRVYLVGRRGPLQVAFTTAELREMVRLEGCKPLLQKTDFSGLEELSKKVPQKRRRLTQLLLKTALETPVEKDATRWRQASKEWALKFLRSPNEIVADDQSQYVEGVNFTVNKLIGDNTEEQQPVPTNDTEFIKCGLVLRSIGYRSVPLSGVEFDEKKAVIANHSGRVINQPGLYCSGWVKRGPVGVIVSTMTDAFETGKLITDDLASGALSVSAAHSGSHSILPLLAEKGVEPVCFTEWNKIDEHEISTGLSLDKTREKITSISTMLEIAKR